MSASKGEPETVACGCLVRAIDVPDDQGYGQGWEVIEPCFKHARCPICGGRDLGDPSHTRCTTSGYEGLDYRL